MEEIKKLGKKFISIIVYFLVVCYEGWEILVEIVLILKSIYSFFVRKKVKLDDLLKFNVCMCMYICRYKI